MRIGRLFSALPLAVLMAVQMPGAAQAQVEVPADCAVPPDIDLAAYNVVIGTDASEVLRGTNGPDFICGRLGNDKIFAYGGNDLVLSDTTTFFGNLQAKGGNDVVHAGAGNDEILPGPGNDKVFGQDGDDFLALALGNDAGNGGRGADSAALAVTAYTACRVMTSSSAGLETTSSTAVPGTTHWPASCRLPCPGRSPPPLPTTPSRKDLCIGGSGSDAAFECDRLVGIETS